MEMRFSDRSISGNRVTGQAQDEVNGVFCHSVLIGKRGIDNGNMLRCCGLNINRVQPRSMTSNDLEVYSLTDQGCRDRDETHNESAGLPKIVVIKCTTFQPRSTKFTCIRQQVESNISDGFGHENKWRSVQGKSVL